MPEIQYGNPNCHVYFHREKDDTFVEVPHDWAKRFLHRIGGADADFFEGDRMINNCVVVRLGAPDDVDFYDLELANASPRVVASAFEVLRQWNPRMPEGTPRA